MSTGGGQGLGQRNHAKAGLVPRLAPQRLGHFRIRLPVGLPAACPQSDACVDVESDLVRGWASINLPVHNWIIRIPLEPKKTVTHQARQAKHSNCVFQTVSWNLGEETMCRAFRLVGAAVMLGSSVLSVAQARAIELTGAWASHEDLCNQVFTKKDNRVEYAEFSELFGSGFIVDGDRIRGKAGTCTIKSRKQFSSAIARSAHGRRAVSRARDAGATGETRWSVRRCRRWRR